ncbi:MAG: enoyl-CoA hydratase/isomerase family protein [Elusimicrobia bacterium]|nr:enoyl-CoA hydratase/isomerase family protein [Elusimicrobiota bacterium]
MPAETTTEKIRTERRGAVALYTIHRPEALNALSDELIAELLQKLEAADKDDAVRVHVLTGGPKVFAAGADIKGMAQATAAEMARKDPLGQWDRFSKLAKPLIAAVNGFALGGGCELAMNADLLIAGEDAVFGQPEILIGVMPGAGGTVRLPRLVGRLRAMELLLTGRRLPARQALEWGLVNAVVPPGQALEEALRLASEIAAQPAEAVRQVKAAVRGNLDKPVLEALANERERFYSLFDTADQKEGMAAFVEKRKPKFTGK